MPYAIHEDFAVDFLTSISYLFGPTVTNSFSTGSCAFERVKRLGFALNLNLDKSLLKEYF